MRHSIRPIEACSVALLLLLASARASGQTPINASGAMQPSSETGVVHLMPMYREVGSDPTSDQLKAREYLTLVQIAYGITKDFSIQFDGPIVYRDLTLSAGSAADDDEFGLSDSTILMKYRIFQDDSGPTETTRFSLIGGLQIPGPDDDLGFEMDSSNGSWDPIIGAVFSKVLGRHGLNADVLWEFYTGDDDDAPDFQSDSLRYDGSYLFRISPEQYTTETVGALYAVAEVNGFYGTNGDHEIYVSPGLMYESRLFTLDATVMIPIHQEVEHRGESEFLIGVGVRVSF